VLFTTAHREHGNVALDWAGVAGSDTTVVIYMPGRKYAWLGADEFRVGRYSRAAMSGAEE
jgi:siroheme synthase